MYVSHVDFVYHKWPSPLSYTHRRKGINLKTIEIVTEKHTKVAHFITNPGRFS